MKSKLYSFLLILIICSNGYGKQIQGKDGPQLRGIDKIPYGNNPEAGHYVQGEDAKIYYEVYGSGPSLVLLHGGLMGSTGEMAEFIDSLKDLKNSGLIWLTFIIP